MCTVTCASSKIVEWPIRLFVCVTSAQNSFWTRKFATWLRINEAASSESPKTEKRKAVRAFAEEQRCVSFVVNCLWQVIVPPFSIARVFSREDVHGHGIASMSANDGPNQLLYVQKNEANAMCCWNVHLHNLSKCYVISATYTTDYCIPLAQVAISDSLYA